MDRIKRFSNEILDKYGPEFGEDFSDNKKALEQVTIIRSKGLKNEVAGYITKHIKRVNRENRIKQEHIEQTRAAAASATAGTEEAEMELIPEAPAGEVAPEPEPEPAQAVAEEPAPEAAEPESAGTEEPEQAA